MVSGTMCAVETLEVLEGVVELFEAECQMLGRQHYFEKDVAVVVVVVAHRLRNDFISIRYHRR